MCCVLQLCVIWIRCRDCGAVLEEYDEETLALAVVVLSMFIHLSPDLAAPLLLEIMQSVGRYGRIRAVRHIFTRIFMVFFQFFALILQVGL